MMKKIDISKMDDRLLLINLYLTQTVILLIAVVLLMMQGTGLRELLSLPAGASPWLWGLGLAAAAAILNAALARFVPNAAEPDALVRRLFRRRPLWHIAVLCFFIAFCEELLFRGALQPWLGPYWTSIVFALLHFRYLRSWLLTGFVFALSYGLGWAVIHTGTLWTPIAAHFLFDLAAGLMIRFEGRDDDAGTH